MLCRSSQVLDVLCGLTALENIEPSDPLMEVGIDSLTSTHFVDELTERTGLRLSTTLIFQYSTAAAVAEHLAQLLGKDDRSSHAANMSIINTSASQAVSYGGA
eukprot:102265-Prymnesium_polylepis.2